MVSSNRVYSTCPYIDIYLVQSSRRCCEDCHLPYEVPRSILEVLHQAYIVQMRRTIRHLSLNG